MKHLVLTELPASARRMPFACCRLHAESSCTYFVVMHIDRSVQYVNVCVHSVMPYRQQNAGGGAVTHTYRYTLQQCQSGSDTT